MFLEDLFTRCRRVPLGGGVRTGSLYNGSPIANPGRWTEDGEHSPGSGLRRCRGHRTGYARAPVGASIRADRSVQVEWLTLLTRRL
jgi:hypothetical protein